MIVYVVDRRGNVGLQLQCDYCGKPVTHAGAAAFIQAADRYPCQAVVVCRGKCHDAVALKVGPTRSGQTNVGYAIGQLVVRVGLRAWMAARLADPLFVRE